MAQIAGIGMVGFEHTAVVGRKYGVRSHNILEPLVDPGHVALQAAVSLRPTDVVRMLPTGIGSDELLVALQADRFVLAAGSCPAGTDRLMGVVTVDALQLGVAPAASRIGVFNRIPRPHSRREFRP